MEHKKKLHKVIGHDADIGELKWVYTRELFE